LNRKLTLLEDLIKMNKKKEVFQVLQTIIPEWQRSKMTKNQN